MNERSTDIDAAKVVLTALREAREELDRAETDSASTGKMTPEEREPFIGAKVIVALQHAGLLNVRIARIFYENEEPPFGECIEMTTVGGDRLVWTGKRWYWPADSDGSLQNQDAWPPDVEGPYFEVR